MYEKMTTVIQNRRSIRKYKAQPVSHELLEVVLRAGMLAPSAKNRQPWEFVVVEGQAKWEVAEVMKRGLAREKVQPLLPESACYLGAAAHTLSVMEQAPVLIFAVNPFGIRPGTVKAAEEHIFELCNAQSLGAAMENMSLAATELGLGSLWICDIYFAYQELQEWLGMEGELAAAMALGYGDEEPEPRPRKTMQEAVTWRI